MKDPVLVHIFLLMCCVVLINAQSYTGLQYITSYQSHAVITSKNTKNTAATPTVMFVEEYQDRVNKIGRIDEIAVGKRRQHFYYMNDKQTATVEGSDNKSCKVRDIAKFIKDEFFQAMANVQNSLLGPTALFFPPSALTSAGEAKVRGISCSKWNYVVDNEYSVTLYLSVKEWNSTELSTEFEKPIRIEANVTDKVTSNIVHVMIDFVLFMANQSFLDDTFVVPVGIGCKSLNREYGNNAQTLKEKVFSSIMRYYINEEIVTTNSIDEFGSFMENFKVVYDDIHNIIQFEGSGRSSNLIFHSVILSFSTGVAYTMKDDGTCSMEPITENSATESLFSNQTEKRKSIQESFKLNNDYSYLGRRFHRTILCDIYETIEENSSEKAVYTYFIAAPNYVSEMDYSSGKSTVVQLLRTINSKSKKSQLEYDIFNVKHMDVETEMLNVDTCFPQSQRSYFAIYFPLDNSNAMDVIISKRTEFEKKARERIYDAAHISRLQLPFVRMYADSKSATLLGQMLNRPPILAGFTEYPPLEEVDSKDWKNKQSAEECARDCLKATFEICMSFDYCPDKCYISPKEDSRAKNCPHFKRAVADSTVDENFLDDALKSLQNAILRNEISLTVTDNSGKDYTLKAKSMDKDLNPFQFNTGSKKKYKLAFEKHEMQLNWHTVYEVQEAVKSVEECYQKCHELPYFYCSGFSYCGISNKCRITSLYLTSDNPKAKDELSVATDCDVYMISAIEFFIQYPGKIPKSRGEETAYVQTVESCAIQCRKSSTFQCEGFEFCADEDQKLCIMHSRHILDYNTATDVDATTPSTCSFWFLDYGASFIDYGGVLVVDPLATTILSISFEECAKMCFTQPELNCRSINYCPEQKWIASECMINTKTIGDHVNTVRSELCQHYEMAEKRKEQTTTTTMATKSTEKVTTQKTTTKTPPRSTDSDRSTVTSSFTTGVGITSTTNNIESTTISTSEVLPTAMEYIKVRKGVEPSTFTGAVVGMLFFGLVVGALGFLGYSYYRSRKEDSGITVRFTKEQL